MFFAFRYLSHYPDLLHLGILNSMKIQALIGAGVLLLISNLATAVTVGVTEGSRPLVAGTTKFADSEEPDFPVAASDGITTLASVGDSLEIYGRVVSANDYFTFTSDQAFTVDWIFGGYELADGTDVTTSGFVRVGSPNNTATFDLLDSDGDSIFASGTAFTTNFTSGTSNIFGPVKAGTYVLKISGGGDNGAATYDVAVTAVPLPAAAWLFGSALVGAVVIGRRKRKS